MKKINIRNWFPDFAPKGNKKTILHKKNIIEFFVGFFTRGHERSTKAKKNIVASFLIRGGNIVITLMLVPLTINYLNPTKYGIWITLSSIIAWFGFFDVGLGHGLRNRFAEALANGEEKLAQIYVSTTYAILTLIITLVLILFYIISPLLNWSVLLNAGGDIALQSELGILALIVFTFFCLRFIFKLITTILTADQRPAKASLFGLFDKIIALLLIYILTKTTSGSLLYIGVVMSGAPVLVLFVSSIWFFSGKYKEYKPSYRLIDFSQAKHLFNLGGKFFIIQIAAILLYQTNVIIISHLFGPAEVTPYHVALKYFSILGMGFSIIMSPFWSAVTDAWTREEIGWIKNSMRKLRQAWVIFLIIAFVMFISSQWIYKIWVGEQIVIPYILSALIGIWVMINTWNAIHSHFLNGIGKVKLQLYIGISAAVINVPLAIMLGKSIGIEGVLLCNLILAMIQSLIYPMQFSKIINIKAYGIWNK